MRIYLAAPYSKRDLIREYGAELERIGFTVSSSWLKETHEISSGTTSAAIALDDTAVADHARSDLIDIDRSDTLVLFTGSSLGLGTAEAGSGGRHVETGYALALGKPVVVIGEPENVFHRLGGGVTVVPNWHEALIELSARLVQLTAAHDIVAAPVR